MTTTNQLTQTDAPSAGDLLAIWSTSNGGERALAISALVAYVREQIGVEQLDVQYSSPADGASVSVGNDSHLIVTPTGALAALTIRLPEAATDRSSVLVNCTQAVTALTIDGNGNTVSGAPTALTAGGYFRLKFDAVMSVWYRVA